MKRLQIEVQLHPSPDPVWDYRAVVLVNGQEVASDLVAHADGATCEMIDFISGIQDTTSLYLEVK